MNKLFTKIFEDFFPPEKPLEPGIFQNTILIDQRPQKVQLRIEENGSGLLVINARTILHLNQTATEFGYALLNADDENKIIANASKRYKVDKNQFRQDFLDFKNKIYAIFESEDIDPEITLGMDRIDPYSISKPIRVDCALTYQSSHSHIHKVVDDRVRRELLTKEWIEILKKCQKAGILHVIFTGGEPTIRPDLAELIQFTQDNNMVSGLITGGDRLSEPKYLRTLLDAGLDHIMFVLGEEGEAWEGIRDILSEDIHLSVHITITETNKQSTKQTIDQLKKMGVNSISISASSNKIRAELRDAANYASTNQMKLVCDLPVPFLGLNPETVYLEEFEKSGYGHGKAWIYVEPDGDVLPAQDIKTVMGNLLSQSLEKIMEHYPTNNND